MGDSILTFLGEAGDFAAGIAAVVAIGYAVRSDRARRRSEDQVRADQLQRDRDARTEREKLQMQEQKLLQRQFLLPLWDRMMNLRTLNPDPDEVVWTDVREVANTLELLAASWEGELADRDVIYRVSRGATSNTTKSSRAATLLRVPTTSSMALS
jgi:hypothetical protein